MQSEAVHVGSAQQLPMKGALNLGKLYELSATGGCVSARRFSVLRHSSFTPFRAVVRARDN